MVQVPFWKKLRVKHQPLCCPFCSSIFEVKLKQLNLMDKFRALVQILLTLWIRNLTAIDGIVYSLHLKNNFYYSQAVSGLYGFSTSPTILINRKSSMSEAAKLHKHEFAFCIITKPGGWAIFFHVSSRNSGWNWSIFMSKVNNWCILSKKNEENKYNCSDCIWKSWRSSKCAFSVSLSL